MTRQKLKWIAISISVCFYLACLLSPAVVMDEGPSYGLSLLITGFLGILEGYFTWFANLFYVWAVIFVIVGYYELSGLFALWAFLIAGHFFFAHQTISFNEGGGYDFDHFAIGYYFWLIAMLIAFTVGISMAICKWMHKLKSKRSSKSFEL